MTHCRPLHARGTRDRTCIWKIEDVRPHESAVRQFTFFPVSHLAVLVVEAPTGVNFSFQVGGSVHWQRSVQASYIRSQPLGLLAPKCLEDSFIRLHLSWYRYLIKRRTGSMPSLREAHQWS